MRLSRRRFIACAAALGVPSSALRAQTTLGPTPAMTAGPFYPEAFSLDPQANLVRGALMGGAVLLALEGRVLDRFGKPVAGARVELWQCDALGHYAHSRDGAESARDPNFAGYGWTRSAEDGRYAFATIRPVPYPGRTPHMHLAVKATKARPLITQVFVEGVAQNQRDYLYTSMTQAQRAQVTARLEPAAGGERARFDIVVA